MLSAAVGALRLVSVRVYFLMLFYPLIFFFTFRSEYGSPEHMQQQP